MSDDLPCLHVYADTYRVIWLSGGADSLDRASRRSSRSVGSSLDAAVGGES